jgi:hypothetical protein
MTRETIGRIGMRQASEPRARALQRLSR